MSLQTFIIDCPFCRAKVAAMEKGSATKSTFDPETDPYPEAMKLAIGECPGCKELLVGRTDQIEFEGFDANRDGWTDFVRIYPNPRKTFLSKRITRTTSESLTEADLALQSNANMAACLMLGRALEAVCRDVLGDSVTFSKGVTMLKDKKIIDERLYDWSQQLRAFRNLAAHPDDSSISISRRDAEDLQSFVYAIIEYIYDLTDRYNEFQQRIAKKNADKNG